MSRSITSVSNQTLLKTQCPVNWLTCVGNAGHLALTLRDRDAHGAPNVLIAAAVIPWILDSLSQHHLAHDVLSLLQLKRIPLYVYS